VLHTFLANFFSNSSGQTDYDLKWLLNTLKSKIISHNTQKYLYLLFLCGNLITKSRQKFVFDQKRSFITSIPAVRLDDHVDPGAVRGLVAGAGQGARFRLKGSFRTEVFIESAPLVIFGLAAGAGST
jgi:hypothetical protein